MAPRKANGEGSIYQRKSDNRFVYQFTTPEGRKSVTGKTRKEVIEKKKLFDEQQREQALFKARMGLDNPAAASISLTQWVADWIELYKKPPMVKITTYSTYLFLLGAHIKPFLEIHRSFRLAMPTYKPSTITKPLRAVLTA